MIVSQPRIEIAKWISVHSGFQFQEPYTCLAFIDKTDSIQAAILFDHFRGNDVEYTDVELTIVAKNLPRSLLRQAGRYVFDMLKCRRATFKTRMDNGAAILAMERLGGVLEGRLRNYYGAHDALVFGILEKDYKYGW